MKYVIGMLLGAVLVAGMAVSEEICAQVGPCEIVTIVKDGKITNCTICGSIVNCM